jgi:8-oxo-dGTP pyrophosphatase MutT (NUDIX family)
VDYAEHPRTGAEREALEELGINIRIADPQGESGEPQSGEDSAIIRQEIFTPDGINWLSFTYRVEADIDAEKIVPKDDEIEEARWFSKEGALQVAVSFFDIEAIEKHL